MLVVMAIATHGTVGVDGRTHTCAHCRPAKNDVRDQKDVAYGEEILRLHLHMFEHHFEYQLGAGVLSSWSRGTM